MDVLILPLLFVAVFYFLILRPARNRQKQMSAVQEQLAPGAQVMTGAGLYATVVRVDDETVHLEVAPGVVSTYARGAVARVLAPNPDALPHAAPSRDALPEHAPEEALPGDVTTEPPPDPGSTGPR